MLASNTFVGGLDVGNGGQAWGCECSEKDSVIFAAIQLVEVRKILDFNDPSTMNFIEDKRSPYHIQMRVQCSVFNCSEKWLSMIKCHDEHSHNRLHCSKGMTRGARDGLHSMRSQEAYVSLLQEYHHHPMQDI